MRLAGECAAGWARQLIHSELSPNGSAVHGGHPRGRALRVRRLLVGGASGMRRNSVAAGGPSTTMIGLELTRSFGGPHGRFRGRCPVEGLVVVVVDAPVIMQLKLSWSLLFVLLVVTQIQFNFRVPDVPVPGVHFRRQVGCTLRAQRLVRQWIHALQQFPGAFGRAHAFSS